MGCLKLAHIELEQSPLRCVWKSEKCQKTDVNCYDYGLRFYDPALARWHVVDPMAENHYDFTPYNYCLNNPLLLIDPIGADTSFANEASRNAFNETLNNARTAQDKLEAKLQKTLDKWDKNIISNRLERKADRLAEKLGQATLVNNALDFAINSSDMYHFEGFTPVEAKDGTIVESGGSSSWSTANNRYEIKFWNTAAAGGTILHETRHGIGYSLGEFGYTQDPTTGKTVPSNYDYMDEYVGFMYGSFYNNTTNSKGYKYLTDKALKKHVQSRYSVHPNIIKSFTQHRQK